MKNNQAIYDLGAGDGIVIFAAAKEAYKKNLNTKFIAVEINPILLLILHFRRLFHPNRNNIKILKDNIFSMNFKDLSLNISHLTFYLYISPWYLETVIKNLQSRLATRRAKIKNFSVVSYMYPIKSLKKREKIIAGLHNIYLYE